MSKTTRNSILVVRQNLSAADKLCADIGGTYAEQLYDCQSEQHAQHLQEKIDRLKLLLIEKLEAAEQAARGI